MWITAAWTLAERVRLNDAVWLARGLRVYPANRTRRWLTMTTVQHGHTCSIWYSAWPPPSNEATPTCSTACLPTTSSG
jgi:hypothetical protein